MGTAAISRVQIGYCRVEATPWSDRSRVGSSRTIHDGSAGEAGTPSTLRIIRPRPCPPHARMSPFSAQARYRPASALLTTALSNGDFRHSLAIEM